MRNFQELIKRKKAASEEGQSIVIIALILVALLVFAGIAVDVGFIFARNSQLQAAVDAAALAGVPELIRAANETDTQPADIKAGMFLNTNGVPITNTQGITVTVASSRDLTPLGDTEYSLTVTWPVELYFLRLIQRNEVDLTKSATATINYLADIYASRRVEEGTVSTSTQGIFGPQICVNYGDPFSPWNSPYEPNSYTYQYRIMIPSNYPSDILRVEIFDPDSINSDENFATVARTRLVQDPNAVNPVLPATTTKACGIDSESGTQDDTCVLPTDELNYLNSPLTLDQMNPYWFMRIDENRGQGDPASNGNGTCGGTGTYEPGFNTQTRFELYYYRASSDGSPIRENLASYTGQTGDARDFATGAAAPGDHNTDLYWVSPGAVNQGPDYDSIFGTGVVPVDPGSNSTFEIDLTGNNTNVPNIVVDPGTGARFINLDVTALSGSSENGFEIWAGPPDYAQSVPADVNQRNVVVTNTPGAHYSGGAVVFALGRLPMNSIFDNEVNIPLVFVGPEQAGQTMTVSLFDSDSGAVPPIEFYFDSISDLDWSLKFADPDVTGPDPDGVAEGTRCEPGNCNAQWVDPPYQITVPGVVDDCDYSNPTADNLDCTPFYGGRLMARYIGGRNDTFGWEIRLNGLPRLVR